MPRLFFIAPDGEEGTQINVQSVGQGATRQLASAIEAGDLPAGVVLPPGDFEGQMLFWNGSAWAPVTAESAARIGELTSVEPSSARLFLGTDFVQVTGQPAQLADSTTVSIVTVDNTRFSCSFSDGVAPLARVLGNADGMQLDAGAMGFFDKSPIARPTITGAPMQAQLDSLTGALAALGLCSDGRTLDRAKGAIALATGGVPIVVDLLPAAHAAGLYIVQVSAYVTTLFAAGLMNAVLTWSDPGGAATSPTVGVAGSPLGYRPIFAGFSVLSDGVSPIRLTLSLGGGSVAGGVINLAATAFRAAAPIV